MGLYDIVKVAKCPKCQKDLLNWQTKDMGNMLVIYDVSDLVNGAVIYNDCPICGHVELRAIWETKPIVRLVDNQQSKDISEIYGYLNSLFIFDNEYEDLVVIVKFNGIKIGEFTANEVELFNDNIIVFHNSDTTKFKISSIPIDIQIENFTKKFNNISGEYTERIITLHY